MAYNYHLASAEKGCKGIWNFTSRSLINQLIYIITNVCVCQFSIDTPSFVEFVVDFIKPRLYNTFMID